MVPVAAWAWARWRLDGMQFLGRMFHYDFVARTATALEGHTGSLLYYPNNLQKDHYAWLVAAVVALLLLPLSRAAVPPHVERAARPTLRAGDRRRVARA